VKCWTVEGAALRPCADPPKGFRSLVSIHNHSCHSVERLAALNRVVKKTYMQPFKGVLQASFGLEKVENLNYAEVHFNPPFTPDDVFEMENAAARRLGFETTPVAITDHDEVAGSIALQQSRGPLTALGEELTVRFGGHVFHLGITGLASPAPHGEMQELSRAGRFDELFELLHSTGCLVVLNHPLVSWHGADPKIPLADLLKRYAWAIDAVEFNGMRRREENEGVLQLARSLGKPVVAGGDSHLLVASSVFCATREARTYAEFIAEVKSGVATPLVTSDYFAPLDWKLFLRVVSFMGDYRRIASFRGQPAREMLNGRFVLLDPVGWSSRQFLRVVLALRLAR
jgi:predicted metal-dependent phosphoesterase TrpH